MDSTSGDEGTNPMKIPPKDSHPVDQGDRASRAQMSEADTITQRHGLSGSDSKPPSLPPKNRPQSSTSAEKSTIDQNATTHTVQRNNTGTSWQGTGTIPLTRGTNDHRPLDWIAPQQTRPTTVSERLAPTLETAKSEERKYSNKAKLTGWSLNIAIGLQVVISSLITGLSAVTTGRQTQVMTSILGGVGTVIASYLARARGSNEPELSISRVKDLQKFIRECTSFAQDHGYETGHEYDDRIEEFRSEFEGLLGNGSGERKLSPPV